MRLKQVTVSNFKSYNGVMRITIPDGTSIFVGENGAGKTNLLEAVDFVLGVRHSGLKRDARARYINISSDNKKAFVEIVLHDDGKLFGEEVVIKREISYTSDVYDLNGSRIRKLDMSFVFEVLGLPRATPFHVMSTAQIKELVSSNPSGRLNVLINYLGLCISRSVSFLMKTHPELEDLDKALQKLAERLLNHTPDEIQRESARHNEYKALKKTRSTLRFMIASLHIELWKTKIDKEIETQSFKGTVLVHSIHTLKNSIASTKSALEKAAGDAVSTSVSFDGLHMSKETLVKNLEAVKNTISDLEDTSITEEVDISIGSDVGEKDVKERLAKLETELVSERVAIEEINDKLTEEEQKKNDLLLILRTNKLSATQRKLTFQEEFGKLNEAYEKNVEDMKKCECRYRAAQKSVLECENKIKNLDREEKNNQVIRKDLDSTKHRLNEMQIELQKLNSSEYVILNNLVVASNSLRSKRAELYCKIGNSKFNGLLSVKSVRDTWSSTNQSFANGCYGTVLDNIECDSALNSALDAAVGSSLYSQIVETDVIGTAILREMTSRNMPGEVVFLPLNRIQSHDRPEIRRDGVELLINQLTFPARVRGAIDFLFGRILICRDLELATVVARETRCVCVTIQGDRVVGNGAMTGGYVNRNTSTRTLFLAYESLYKMHNENNVLLRNTREEINSMKSNIDSLVASIQRSEVGFINSDYVTSRKILMSQLENDKKNIVDWEKQMRILKRHNEVLCKKKETFENSFSVVVPVIEVKSQLQASNKKTLEYEKELKNHNANLDLIISEIDLLKFKIHCSSQKRNIKVSASSKSKAIVEQLKDYKIKEELLTSRLRIVDEEINRTSVKLASFHKKVEELTVALDNLKEQLASAESKSTGLQTTQDSGDLIRTYEEKIKHQQNIKNTAAKNVDNQLLTQLSALSLQELRTRLCDTTRDLDEFAKTLKMSPRTLKMEMESLKLWDLYNETKEAVSNLHAMLPVFQSWIKQHVSKSLDDVCNSFIEYFSMIVGNGSGSLHVEKSDEEPVLGITGLSASVIFSGDSQVSLLPSLSTGQQVSFFLAVIFSLMHNQRPCFCVFDEIDQCLTNDRIDGALRAISELVLRNHQFLISSHNLRTISGGNHHFIIKHRRGKTYIRSVESNEAAQCAEDALFSSQSTIMSVEHSSQQSHSSTTN